MSYYHIQQEGIDMTILHFPDETVHWSEAASKRAAIIKAVSSPSPQETAKPHIYLNYLSNMTE